MKKLYLFAAGLAVFGLNAQTLNNVAEIQNYNGKATQTQAAPSTVFTQTANNQNGYGVGYLEAFGGGIYLADDFEVSQTAKITKIRTFGFTTVQPYTTLGDATTELKMYIFEDGNGAPASLPAAAYKTITVEKGAPGITITVSGQLYEMSIDLVAAGIDLTLDSKTRYWFSVAPTTNLEDDVRYAWFKATGNKYSGQVQLVDPDDLFEIGLTDWTPLNDILTNPWGDFGLAFTITGETDLGVSEAFSSFKALVHNDRTTNSLRIVLGEGNQLLGAEVYDATGKKVISSDNSNTSLNTVALPSGVYFVLLKTKKGIEKTKFIK